MSKKEMSCRRCGTCCRKGGPGLHREDGALIAQGIFSCEDIVCFRQGELAYNQASDRVEPLACELLKLRGKAGTWECIFYDPESKGCGIYEGRPLECRTLMCWDTAPLEKIMTEGDRLQRRDIVPADSGLWELIVDHEKGCALAHVIEYVREYAKGTTDARGKIIDLCRYDQSFREALMEKTGASEGVLACYFGRPLFQAIRGHDPWFGSEDFLHYFDM